MAHPTAAEIANMITIGVEQKAYPRNLFKYRSLGQFTEKIITDNEVYFSDPLIFNDPYDCNTPINVATPLSDIKVWLHSVGIDPAQVDYYANILKDNPDAMREATELAMSKLGLCCFSTLEDSILEWSHYSDYHKGICLKFDITEDPEFFFLPVIVAYRKVMQHYNHFVSPNKVVEYLIKPKYSDWSYESEIRIVKYETMIAANRGSRAFKYKNNALKEVIFGAKATDATIAHYKALCAAHGKAHVQFFRMILGTGTHYELVKVPA